MRGKLTLKLEDLAVDSFDTAPVQKPRGTVVGEQGPCTCPTACTCPGCPTCYETCAGQASCGNTCGGDTCVYTCYEDTCAAWCGGTAHTYCDCGATCGQTDCGPYFCCA
jgi:hypothetical protein